MQGRGPEAFSKSKGKNTGRKARWQIKVLRLLFKNPMIAKSAFKYNKHALVTKCPGALTEENPLSPGFSHCELASRQSQQFLFNSPLFTPTPTPAAETLRFQPVRCVAGSWGCLTPSPELPSGCANAPSPTAALPSLVHTHTHARTPYMRVHIGFSTNPLSCPCVPSASPGRSRHATLTAKASGELHEVRIIPVHAPSSVHSPRSPRPVSPENHSPQPQAQPTPFNLGAREWSSPPRSRERRLGQPPGISQESASPAGRPHSGWSLEPDRQLVPVSNHA